MFWSTQFTLVVWHGHSARRIMYNCLKKTIAPKSMMQSLQLRDPIRILCGIIVSGEPSHRHGTFPPPISVAMIQFIDSQDTTKPCD
jgi:hypothetical protein